MAMIKKSVLWGISLAALFAICCTTLSHAQAARETGYIMIEPGHSRLLIGDTYISSFEGKGCTYFFLPSYVELEGLDYSLSGYRLYDADGRLLVHPVYDEETFVTVSEEGTDDTEGIPYRVAFYRSGGLYTAEIHTDGYDIWDVDRETYRKARMRITSPGGREDLPMTDIYIRGRGNTSWHHMKRSYQIKLDAGYTLCGMQADDKWALLSDQIDRTKMLNKLAYDFASDIGLEYVIESDWIDVYVDGDYMGNFLLCHEPDYDGSLDTDLGALQRFNNEHFDESRSYEDEKGKGYLYDDSPADISGGYLVEANQHSYYNERRAGCRISCGQTFTVKTPSNASREQVEYMAQLLDEIDTDPAGSRIDRYSFARRYLVYEIFMNQDTALTSYFFYKKPGRDMLYAGPVWDFDRSGGYVGPSSDVPGFRDYTGDLSLMKDEEALDWDDRLMEDDGYAGYLRETFARYERVYDRMLNKTIDAYYRKIRSSAAMDRIRWEDDTVGQYRTYENDVRYLKFFLYNRLMYLNDKYGTDIRPDVPYEDTGETHVLTFVYNDGSEVRLTAKDGALIPDSELPGHPEGMMWYSKYMSEFFSEYIPVYEDMTFTLVGL